MEQMNLNELLGIVCFGVIGALIGYGYDTDPQSVARYAGYGAASYLVLMFLAALAKSRMGDE
jgi:hypothetical protein